MLQLLRKNTKVFAWLFVIVLVFVFGVTSFTFNKHDQYAGEIFGKKISFQELRIFETLTRLLPPDPKILENPQTAYAFAWQQMILSHEAKSQKIEVSDNEVRTQVDRLINAQNPGIRISPDEYTLLLKGWRTTPYEFESGVRELIRIQKMMAQHFESSREAAKTSPSSQANNSPSADNEQAALEENYSRWMMDIYTRANFIDYSQTTNKNTSAEEVPHENS